MIVKRKIFMNLALSEIIRQESQVKFPRETGGILVGRFEEDNIVVVHVIGPGPRATHGLSTFVRDGEYAQQELDAFVGTTEGRNDYVGEWHSHPMPVGPSSRDKESMRWISKQSVYNCTQPALILCQRTALHDWSLHGYLWVDSRLHSLPIVDILY